MKKLKINNVDLSDQIYEKLNISGHAAEQYISHIRGGFGFTMFISKSASKNAQHKMATVLYALGVERDDKEISKIKEIYPHFRYPPRRK